MSTLPEVVARPACILIVDDEDDNRSLLTIILGREGFLIVSVASGAEAFATVLELRPDLMLLDVMMPEMDGYAVAIGMKGDLATRHIPILMITALDDALTRRRAFSAGANGFLTKPLDRAQLCWQVRHELGIVQPDLAPRAC